MRVLLTAFYHILKSCFGIFVIYSHAYTHLFATFQNTHYTPFHMCWCYVMKFKLIATFAMLRYRHNIILQSSSFHPAFISALCSMYNKDIRTFLPSKLAKTHFDPITTVTEF